MAVKPRIVIAISSRFRPGIDRGTCALWGVRLICAWSILVGSKGEILLGAGKLILCTRRARVLGNHELAKGTRVYTQLRGRDSQWSSLERNFVVLSGVSLSAGPAHLLVVRVSCV